MDQKCPECASADIESFSDDSRAGHGLDENPGKEYARCMSCYAILLRPAGSDDYWKALRR